MSSGLAIASITAILKNLLEDGLVQNTALSSMGNILVTTLPPDQISVGVDGQPQLNLFMYQVSQNRNADWIGCDRNHPNHVQASTLENENPPLAINLHYLLTVYGAKDFQTELLLGAAMQIMHETPVISNDAIRIALNHIASINRAGFLAQAIESTSVATLTEQLGQVQITPDLFGAEQMSRLWSLLQSPYRPSVAYDVSMVFIGPQKSVVDSEPHAELLGQPHIEKVIPAQSAGDSIAPRGSLIIYGKNLQGEITKICLNESNDLLDPQIIEDSRLLFNLPQTLPIGPQTIKVVHQYAVQGREKVVSNENTFVYPACFSEENSLTEIHRE